VTTLYVTDLDGTLLGPDARLSGRTASVVERLRDDGVLLTCATARSWTTVQRVLGDVRFALPMVLYNGVFTFDAVRGRLLDRHTLPRIVVEAVVEVCREHGVPPLVYSIDDDGTEHVSWVIGAENDGIRSFWRDRPADPRNAPRATWSSLPTAGVFTVDAIGGHDEIAAVAEAIRSRTAAAASCEVHVAPDTYHPEEFWLDVSPAGTSKAAALVALQSSLGADRLVVFGDNVNDLPMFAVADESYAVANAVPDVLAAATGVIGSNADDGVAAWLSANVRA
jgi:5-amino-6-(5-phospho-D-ribitylamino)uracil phosphatase